VTIADGINCMTKNFKDCILNIVSCYESFRHIPIQMIVSALLVTFGVMCALTILVLHISVCEDLLFVFG